MLKQARTTIIRSLWEDYLRKSSQMQTLKADLAQKGAADITLDHFAIIDLPSPNTGIPVLREIFESLGYVKGGAGYLADKQNDFLWLADKDSFNEPSEHALPQVVVADFRLEELPNDIRHIIEKYAKQTPPSPLEKIKELVEKTKQNDITAATTLISLVTNYCTTRDWPLPTVSEYDTVFAWNRLLAWVLVFGRTPNHFTLSLQHLSIFQNIADFHRYVEEELKLPLNEEGGKIKGDEKTGLMQGSTVGTQHLIPLNDGTVSMPSDFIEFVWRFPKESGKKPTKWLDYFNGFIAENADKVIESLTTR